MSESRYSLLPADAVDDLELTLADLRVLGAIGYHTGRKKAAWPKQATLAERLKLSRETVNRSVRRLHRKGYIDIAHQHRSDGGQRESLYFPRLDPDPTSQLLEIEYDGELLALVPRVTAKSQGGCDGQVTPPVTPEDHTPCDVQTSHLVEDTHKNIPKKKVTPNPKGNRSAKSKVANQAYITAAVRSEFDGLWRLWPDQGRTRSKAKDLCLAQFAKAARDVAPSLIVEAGSVFVRKNKPEYTPALDRWLRDRKYEHFLPQAAELPLAAPHGGADDAADMQGWADAAERYRKKGYWPRSRGGRPDDGDYRGPVAPLEAILATGKVGHLNVPMIKHNIDRLRANQPTA